MAVSVYHITLVSAQLLFLCALLSSAQTTYYVTPDNDICDDDYYYVHKIRASCSTDSDQAFCPNNSRYKDAYNNIALHPANSDDTRCPNTCHTLSWYAQNSNQYFSSEVDIVLNFLPGVHNLATELNFTNVSRVTLAGNKTVERRSIIFCNPQNSTGLTFTNITNVHISHLDFLSCGKPGHTPHCDSSNAISADRIGNFQLTNTTLQGSRGTALCLASSNATIEQSTYVCNSATTFGGALVIAQSTVHFKDGNQLGCNSAHRNGGGIYCSNSTIHFTGAVHFKNNTSSMFGGGAHFSNNSSITATGNMTFIDNAAFAGGTGNYDYNTGAGGGFRAEDSSLDLSSNINFTGNSATQGGGVSVSRSRVFFKGECRMENNMALVGGGGIYCSNSTINFTGAVTFNRNSASQGGAIYTTSASLVLSEKGLFTHNTAEYFGGGMFISNTTKLAGSLTFQINSASQGGGMSLEQNALLYLESPLTLHFESNNATRGGAIFVEDGITLSDCFQSGAAQSTPESDSKCFVNHCFFQFNSSDFVHTDSILNFVNNLATEAGTVLFGGKLKNCTFIPELQDNRTALDVFMNISNITNDENNDTSIISSDPIRLCLYNYTTCNSDLDFQITTIPGAKFTIPAIAKDQANRTVPTAIRSYFIRHRGVNAELGEQQHIQYTNKTFTDLKYQVFSTRLYNYEKLVLYPEGPCRDIGIAKHSIQIHLLPCPDGFYLSSSRCICEKRLQKFTNSCVVDSGTILRDSKSTFWMNGLYDDHNYKGLILHPHCPFDYCVTETIYIMPNDSSAQCANNRAGILCGSCQSNFSLVFGSSHCLQCSNAYLSLLLPFAAAGLALVILLLALHLTVSVGTINGLIFYANVLAINQALFFPPGETETNILTVFVAWLNLDLGIEACFYDGMDAYARTWLQFAFPIYIWSLVGIIMAVSSRFPRLSRLLGTNPVSVLATLFLLSYAKVLRAILASLRFTKLEYPDGYRYWYYEYVWLYDGNVLYFSAKHFLLCLVVLVLLVLFLAYTLLLLLGQWLQALSNRKLFSWISKPKVKAFLDAYHGPYEDKHRYWTGLLLLIRLTLCLVSVSNVNQDPSTSLLSIASVSLGLSVMTRFTGNIYKKQWLDALEASFILNLGILAAATYHVNLKKGNQAALTYTSVSIVFATFIGIIIYHSYIQTQNNRLLKNFPRPNILQITRQMIDKYRRHNENEVQSPGSETREEVSSSVVYIELREPLLEDS